MKHLAIFCSITQTNTLYKEGVHLPDLKFDKSSKSIQVLLSHIKTSTLGLSVNCAISLFA